MSYDIELVDPITRETLTLPRPHHMRGGTYAVGGSYEASLAQMRPDGIWTGD